MSNDIERHKAGAAVQARHKVPPVTTIADLRALLGIKSLDQLKYFLVASDYNGGPYTVHEIPKRDGSKRLICAPKTELKVVQRRILDLILARLPTHPAAYGFVPGRSIVDNARAHVGADVIVKYDLKDFFPTVTYFRVMGLFASFGYAAGDCRWNVSDDSTKVAPVLARLCCYGATLRDAEAMHLPQGAPTSPTISNLVTRRMDARLTGLVVKHKGVYTRYADDLTFSFKEVDRRRFGVFRASVEMIVKEERFVVNEKKFRVVRDSQRQLVTGIVVNDALRVPRMTRRKLRAMIHNCSVTGIAAQAARHPQFRGDVEGFKHYVLGMKAYISMVEKEPEGEV